MNKLEKLGVVLLGSGAASCVGPSHSTRLPLDRLEPENPLIRELDTIRPTLDLNNENLYVVRNSENFYSIAKTVLHDTTRYLELRKLNPDLPFAPPAGTLIRLPAKDDSTKVAETNSRPEPLNQAEAQARIAEYKRYTVSSGDTLWNIAERALGSGKRSSEIVALNPQLIPTEIGIGTEILLPSGSLEIPPIEPNRADTSAASETQSDTIADFEITDYSLERAAATTLAASPQCVEFLKSWEGLNGGTPALKAYKCQGKVWTIGWGTTRGVSKGMTISEDEAERMFLEDLEEFQEIVRDSILVPVYQFEFDAMLSLCYNIGPGDPDDGKPAGFLTSSALRLLNQGQYDAVPDAIKLWNKAGGKVSNGLLRRRSSEAEMFRGVYLYSQ